MRQFLRHVTALRRLVQSTELSDDDLRALTEICKSAHGLAEEQDVVPLAQEHVPETGTGTTPVSLVSIFHHQGVNALAQDQTLKFGPQLTVVYGDNAAGKTGRALPQAGFEPCAWGRIAQGRERRRAALPVDRSVLR